MAEVWHLALGTPEVEKSPNFYLSDEYCAKRDACNLEIINHYTNMESLLKIISSKYWKFTRIDKVNDKTEGWRVREEGLDYRTFVACFDKSLDESIPLWYIYTQKGQGVRLQLKYNNNSIGYYFADKNKEIISNGEKLIYGENFHFCMHNVIYSDSLEHNGSRNIIWPDGGIEIDRLAVRKSTAWKYENETRIVVYVQNGVAHSLADYILVPIDFTRINTITITFDPWMSEEIKDCMKYYILNNMSDFHEIKIEFQNSVFTEKIER